MADNKSKTEKGTLEKYRVAFENVKTQPAIAAAMTEFGYDETIIAVGKTLLETTRSAYTFHDTEDDETAVASASFKTKRKELENLYKVHRKKAKVAYRKDAVTASRLAITGTLSKQYVVWLETVKKFYATALAETDIQTKLATVKVTLDELNAGNTLIGEVELTRSEYLRETGESQDATKAKDAAFKELEEWMQDFYAVARIALEDNPQLLEAIGLFVRS